MKVEVTTEFAAGVLMDKNELWSRAGATGTLEFMINMVGDLPINLDKLNNTFIEFAGGAVCAIEMLSASAETSIQNEREALEVLKEKYIVAYFKPYQTIVISRKPISQVTNI